MNPFRYFKVEVLASEYWKAGQFIIQISEFDFLHNNISKRKRLMKRAPEFWIFINTNDLTCIQQGLLKLREEKQIVNGNEEIRYRVDRFTNDNYDSSKFEEEFKADFAEVNPDYVAYDEKQLKKEYKEDFGKSVMLTTQETEFISQLTSKINNNTLTLQQCPPHKFIVSVELKIIFCEKCGKTKPI